MRKSITDSRIIAGFFRESIFYSRDVFIKGSESSSLYFQVADLEEGSSRSKASKRTVYLVARNGLSTIDLEGSSLVCNFPHFVAEWSLREFKLELIDGKEVLSFPLPEVLSVSDRRRSRRTFTSLVDKMELSVLVQTRNIYAEARLEVEDISSEGLGGVLTLNVPLSLEVGSRVVGEGYSNSGSMRVSGSIAKAATLDGEAKYRVGIKQDRSDAVPPVRTAHDERRKFARTNTPHFSTYAFSPFNAKHKIKLNVVNASVSGFSAVLGDQSDKAVLPLGCGIAVEGTSLVGELTGIDSDLVRIEIVAGDEKDRLWWLKQLSKYQLKNIHSGLAVGNDILELFCEAGAVAPGFLKKQAKLAKQVTSDLGSFSGEESWLHRWIERGPSGEIHGHIGAVRLADALWHIGDIAGLYDEKKISPDFVSTFIKTFGSYTRSLDSRTCTLIGWKLGHPYWEKFGAVCRSSGCDIFSFSYFRFLESVSSEGESVVVRELRSSSIPRGIQGRALQLAKYQGGALLEYLDFTPINFGSPNLAEAVDSRRKKKYFEVSGKNFNCIVTQATFPNHGPSLLKTACVWFVFPTIGSRLDSGGLVDLGNAMSRLSSANGGVAPGYFVVRESGNSELEGSTSTLNYCLLDGETLVNAAEKI